jgi:hypothetical protein
VEIRTIEIFGFVSAIEALRLPFKNRDKSDSTFSTGNYYIKEIDSFKTNSSIIIGENDLRLLKNLIKNGDEHAKVVRGINVICSIKTARYMWCEIDTYSIGATRLCSESTMHCECHGLTGEELQKAKSEIKEGLEQERIQMFSYQTLRRIYRQRRNHRLPEWLEFCKYIEKLPFSNQLITIGILEDETN